MRAFRNADATEGRKARAVMAVSLQENAPRGALAGTYTGADANASLGEDFGANDLIGGFNKAHVLQPYSLQTQEGVNFAAGTEKVTLKALN